MTNSEYFEKNQISFAKAMEIFNKQKNNRIKSFDRFLNSKHIEPKFKVGDLIVLQRDRVMARCGACCWKHNAVLKIDCIDEPSYWVEFLTPDGVDYIGRAKSLSINFIDNCCVLY